MFPDQDDVDEHGTILHSRDKYPKHIEFMNAGSSYIERAFVAANRVGKSMAGGYEMVCHLTGKYPHWWQGKRFNRPVTAWMAGDRGDSIRDGVQRIINGQSETGTGLIPRED